MFKGPVFEINVRVAESNCFNISIKVDYSRSGVGFARKQVPYRSSFPIAKLKNSS